MSKHVLWSILVIGCSSSSSAPVEEPRPEPTPEPTAALTIRAQVEQGKALYVENCARCHGDAGQGGDKAPPVVGPEAFPLAPREGQKRDVEFRTAADVFAWTTAHMPPTAPGGLSTDEYLAIFAFDLTANGVELTAPLDAATAQSIVLH
jgi:cytochrome c